MNDNALNDLLQKIRNVSRDFEFEMAADGTIISLDVRVRDGAIVVQAKERATGGPLSPEAVRAMGKGSDQGREMFVPVSGGVIVPSDHITLSDGDATAISKVVQQRRQRMEDTLRRADEYIAHQSTHNTDPLTGQARPDIADEPPTPKSKPSSTL
jgi:hypothetical protein